MTPRRQTRKNKPLEIRAAQTLRGSLHLDTGPATITAAAGVNKVPTFKMAAYNGGLMNVSGFALPVVVDIAGIEATDRERPILLGHDMNQRVGHATAFTTGKTLSAEGLISCVNAHSREVVDSAGQGFPWQASIGASVLESYKLKKGEVAKINGRTIDGPAFVATRSRLNEVSFVTLGADESTSASISAGKRKDATMTYKQWLAARGITEKSLKAMTPKNRTALRASYDAECKAIKARARKSAVAANAGSDDDDAGDDDTGADDNDDDADVEASAAGDDDDAGEDDDDAENENVDAAADTGDPEDDDDEEDEDDGDSDVAATAANAAVMASRKENARVARIEKICANKHDDIKAKAIEKGWTVQRTELACYKANTPRTTAGIAFRGKPATVVLEAAVLAASGLYDDKKLVEDYGERTVESAHKRFKGRIGLQDLFIEAATMNGYQGRTNFKDSGALREILATGFSNANFSGILSNITNKVLMAGFNDSEQEWRKIFKVSSLSDFKPRTSYRMTLTGRMEPVGADGELKHAQLSDKSYGLQADTFGLIVAITRKMLIDDDMGAITDIPRQIGFNAAQTINAACWGLFLSAQATFFTTGNKNILTSATTPAATALGIDGFTNLEVLLRQQKNDSGDPIGVAGKPKLLVPAQLAGVARQLLASQFVVFQGTPQQGNANPAYGRAEVVESEWIGKDMKGGSDNDYFMFRNSALVPAFEIGFLNGVQKPQVETSDADFAQLGVQQRGYFDFGVASVDVRGAVKMDNSPTGPDTAL